MTSVDVVCRLILNVLYSISDLKHLAYILIGVRFMLFSCPPTLFKLAKLDVREVSDNGSNVEYDDRLESSLWRDEYFCCVTEFKVKKLVDAVKTLFETGVEHLKLEL